MLTSYTVRASQRDRDQERSQREQRERPEPAGGNRVARDGVERVREAGDGGRSELLRDAAREPVRAVGADGEREDDHERVGEAGGAEQRRREAGHRDEPRRRCGRRAEARVPPTRRVRRHRVDDPRPSREGADGRDAAGEQVT